MNHINTITKKIDNLLNTKERIIIAIDGRCASGKSTLAHALSKIYPCNIFHMDHFYLPNSKRSKETYKEIGGIIDFQRFNSDIVVPLRMGSTINYEVFSCSQQKLTMTASILPKKITIIEGAYCLHPNIKIDYDFMIFLTHDKTSQYQRIIKRDGTHKLPQFLNTWIPLEENYLASYQIIKKCHIILDTSMIW